MNHYLEVLNDFKEDVLIRVYIFFDDHTKDKTLEIKPGDTLKHALKNKVILRLFISGILEMPKVDTDEWEYGKSTDVIHVTAKEFGGG